MIFRLLFLVAFCVLYIGFPMAVARADGSALIKTYSITPTDADAKLVFTFGDQNNHNWTDLFTSSTTRAAVKQWQAVSSDQVSQNDNERQKHLLTLLYWQGCFLNASADRHVVDAARAPHSVVDSDELKKLHYAPSGLPTEVISNAFNNDGHWYQSALQQILSGNNEQQEQPLEVTELLNKIVKGTGQGRDILSKWATSLRNKAQNISESDLAKSNYLQSEADELDALAGKITIVKDQDDFKFKISAALRKQLPHELFTGTGDKTVKLPIDKVLIIMQLLSAFTQNLAVSSDRARQVTSLLDYAHDHQISVNADFDAQARFISHMAGDKSEIILASFLSTTLDWAKQTVVLTTPKALQLLSKQLSTALEKSAPEYAGSLSIFSTQVVSRFALLFAASAGADLLFNTSGTYEGIKAAEFSERCAEQFDQIVSGAQKQLSEQYPAPKSLTSWAIADYFHEESVANYHKDYASLLDGARSATLIGNFITGGSIDDSILAHKQQATIIYKGAFTWVIPQALPSLVALFRFDKGPAKLESDTSTGITAVRKVSEKLKSPRKVHSLVVIHTFNNMVKDGGRPYSGLIQARDGDFYGTASEGGENGDGIVFKMSASGHVTILYSFRGFETFTVPERSEGGAPTAALVEGNDGYFYGTTSSGGSGNQSGTAFKISHQGICSILHIFRPERYDGSQDGINPQYPLILASDGNFYGTTEGGGKGERGTVYRLTPQGNETILHSFRDGSIDTDGSTPSGPVVQAKDGNFYGVTYRGGEFGPNADVMSGYGTVYQVTPTGRTTILHRFGTIDNDGLRPQGSLVEAANGLLYGVADGGAQNVGAVFSISRSGEYHIVHSFPYEGAHNPVSGLLLADDGLLYGVLGNSEAPHFLGSSGGAIYRMSLDGSVKVVSVFSNGIGYISPNFVPLTQGQDRFIYGMANQQGTNGIIFRF